MCLNLPSDKPISSTVWYTYAVFLVSLQNRSNADILRNHWQTIDSLGKVANGRGTK